MKTLLIVILTIVSLVLFSTLVYSQENWVLHYVDSVELVGEDGNATNAFDGNASTIWHTEWKVAQPSHPHEIQINLGEVYNIKGFRYLPRQNQSYGRVAQYEFHTSLDDSDWNIQTVGTFKDGIDEKIISFAPVQTQYIRFVALNEVNGRPWTSVAELDILKNEETYKISLTWDYPTDEPRATGFDIRVNGDDDSLIFVSKDSREWIGTVELVQGENVFDMRTRAEEGIFSIWSEPASFFLQEVLI